jgi:hypothetical protein
MVRSGVCSVCEDSKAAWRGLIVVGVAGGFGVQHWKSPSRYFQTRTTTSPAVWNRRDLNTRGLETHELTLLYLDAGRVEEDVPVPHQAVACVREYIVLLIFQKKGPTRSTRLVSPAIEG